MLNISNHWRNAYQNHKEISSHACQNGLSVYEPYFLNTSFLFTVPYWFCPSQPGRDTLKPSLVPIQQLLLAFSGVLGTKGSRGRGTGAYDPAREKSLARNGEVRWWDRRWVRNLNFRNHRVESGGETGEVEEPELDLKEWEECGWSESNRKRILG